MLMMIEVQGNVSQTNGAASGVVASGLVDVRGNRYGITQRNLVRLMERARPLSGAASASGKTPSLYETLPINIRAAVQKEQPLVSIIRDTQKVACKKFYHQNTKTHNNVSITITPISVPRVE
jgi:hypothetical protein